MKIKGWIKIDLTNYKSCNLIMSNGKIYEVKFDGQKPLDFIHYHSSAATDFEFEKHYDKSKAPYKSNYYISYLGGSKQPVLIFLNLNNVQVFKINWQLKKYLLQDKAMKLAFIGAVFGVFGTLATQKISQYINGPKKQPPTEIKESLKETKNQIDLKKDSILAK